MQTQKFKIGDKVRIKQGLTEINTGIPSETLLEMYENNINTIIAINIYKNNTIEYTVKNLKKPRDLTFIFLEEELELISEETNLSLQVETLVKETLDKLLNEPYKVKVK